MSERGQLWLEEVELEGHAGQMLAGLREILVVVQAKVDDFERMVEQISAKHPVARRLRTIPDIGPVLGLSLAVEIGDIKRFPSPGHLRSYSGLTPAVSQSGEKEARGPITKHGNKWLRHSAVLAAQRMSQMHQADPGIKRTFLSVAFRHGRHPRTRITNLLPEEAGWLVRSACQDTCPHRARASSDTTALQATATRLSGARRTRRLGASRSCEKGLD